MLTGGSVAGTTYVGRHVAVLRTTKKAGSGWVIDGAPTMLFYQGTFHLVHFVHFFVVVRADEKIGEIDSMAIVVRLNQYFTSLFCLSIYMKECTKSLHHNSTRLPPHIPPLRRP